MKFVLTFYGTRGDVEPGVALGRELLRRGHDVRMAVPPELIGFAEAAERTASRIGGALLFVLAAYVVVAAGWSLWTRQGAEFSWPGLLVSLATIPIMCILYGTCFH